MIMSFHLDSSFLDTDPKKLVVHKIQSIVTTMISPPCLDRLVLPRGFQNHRLTYQNTDDLSTSRFNNMIVKAIITIRDCMQQNYNEKTRGIIVLSMLDLFTYDGSTVLVSQGNLARVNRFVCSLLDTIMRYSNYRAIVVMPYIHKLDTDLPKLQSFEHKLQEAVSMDTDLHRHIFSRIRFFSILKTCLDYQNTVGTETGSSLMNQFDGDRFLLTTDGYKQVSARLSEDIVNWVMTSCPETLKVPQPLLYTQDRLEAITRQLFSEPMVINPKDLKKPKPAPKKPAPVDPSKSAGPTPKVLLESEPKTPKVPKTSQKNKNDQLLPDPAPKKVKQNPEPKPIVKKPAPIAPKKKYRSKKIKVKLSVPRNKSHALGPYPYHQGYPWFHPPSFQSYPQRGPFSLY